MKVVNNASLKDIFNTSIYDFNNFKKDKLHEICPYTAMFPPKLANSLIENYSTTGQTVYDPFSGRGTTLLQSRLLNRKAYASDLNPLALVLSKAKSKKISINLINKRINELEKTYANSKKIIIDYLDYEYMKTYFSDEIYNQLIFVKNLIGIN
ncbi:MAG: site-specific DNA-methyltransferase [Methanobrevibacter sp.]|jgi:DNA modification methylase|nr:site-specific DNA-methyltransferase [Candidatus Methanovirga aequatorialis]